MKLGLSKTARLLCALLVILGMGFLVLGIVITLWIYPFEPAPAYAIGLTVGICHSMLKVVLMERSLNRAADMVELASARGYGAMHAIFRNFLTLALFVLVYLFRDILGMFGAIVGALALQPAGYIAGYLLRKNSIKV